MRVAMDGNSVGGRRGRRCHTHLLGGGSSLARPRKRPSRVSKACTLVRVSTEASTHSTSCSARRPGARPVRCLSQVGAPVLGRHAAGHTPACLHGGCTPHASVRVGGGRLRPPCFAAAAAPRARWRPPPASAWRSAAAPCPRAGGGAAWPPLPASRRVPPPARTPQRCCSRRPPAPPPPAPPLPPRGRRLQAGRKCGGGGAAHLMGGGRPRAAGCRQQAQEGSSWGGGGGGSAGSGPEHLRDPTLPPTCIAVAGQADSVRHERRARRSLWVQLLGQQLLLVGDVPQPQAAPTTRNKGA